jgi:hypothetical protein
MNLSVPNSTSMFNFLHNGTLSNIVHVGSVGSSNNPGFERMLIRNSGGSTTVGFFIYYDDVGQNDVIGIQVNRGVSGDLAVLNMTLNDNYLPNKQNLLFTSFDSGNAIAANRNTIIINNGNLIKNNAFAFTPSNANSTNNFIIGDGLFGNFVGKYQEIIVYGNDNNSNRTGIETNINTHYAIY